MSSSLRVGAATLLALVLAGCAGSSGEDGCGPAAGCAPSFTYDGVLYVIGCLGVAPGALGPDLAAVRVDDGSTRVRSLARWTAGQALAIQVVTTGCGNPGDAPSDWSLALPLRGPASWGEQDRIACAVGLAGPGVRQSLACPSPAG